MWYKRSLGKLLDRVVVRTGLRKMNMISKERKLRLMLLGCKAGVVGR
jgi:hypothetical protein